MDRFFEDNPEDLEAIVTLLKKGRVVAVPTETVYGLAADALNVEACRRIFEIKCRPLIDPLIVHVYDRAQAALLAQLTPLANRLAESFWPGPLTLVLPKKPLVPDLITAGRPTVALRSPQHPLLRKVLKISGLALAAPSANPFSCLSPTTAAHVREALGTRAPYILDGGGCTIGVESTIVDLSVPERPVVLRPGPITADALQAALANTPVESAIVSVEGALARKDEGVGLPAPGLLSKHYCPRTPLFLLRPGVLPPKASKGSKIAWVRLERTDLPCPAVEGVETHPLSERGSLAEAARNLFGLLHQLDARRYKAIYVTKLPNEGLGTAMNDRLKRASSGFI